MYARLQTSIKSALAIFPKFPYNPQHMGAEVPVQLDTELFRTPEIREGEVFDKYAIAFDGHGLQFQGMGKEFLEAHPEAERYYKLAHEVLGYDLLDLCTNGSKDQLNMTEFAQPAIVVYNLVASHALAQALPEQMKITPEVISYQSLGMLNAIHKAGMLGDPESDESIRSLVRLAQVRGKIMQERSEEIDGGMWLVSGAKNDERIDRKAKKRFPRVVNYFNERGIVPAIDRNEAQIVVSGLVDDFKAIDTKRLQSIGFRTIRLPSACGPFHSEHMRPAADKFAQVLEDFYLEDAQIDIQSNSHPIRRLRGADEIKEELVNGIVGRVYSREMINQLHDDDIEIFEVGEKKLIADPLGADERYESPKGIPVKKIATAGGIATALAVTGAVAGFLIKKRYAERDDKEDSSE